MERKPVSEMTKREFRDHLLLVRRKIMEDWEQCNRDAAHWNEHVLPKYPGANPLPILGLPVDCQEILDKCAAELIVLDAELGIEQD